LIVIDSKPFILIFGAKGKNFSFEYEVKPGFYVDPILNNDEYNKLCEILELKYDPNNHFKITGFLSDFNKCIPAFAESKNIPKPQEIIAVSKNIDEADKIYFCRWYDNESVGKKVRPQNLEKTRRLLGEKAYLRCKDKNISSCWTPDINSAESFYLP
jgi:hypothetical protein